MAVVTHDRTEVRQRPRFAFLTAVPIAILGGLIGLGGAEFRLPVLAGPSATLSARPCPSTWR